MARPTKNSCEYFPHDRDMRNHRKIKSIRNKFGISGYGIWCMILEHLTGADGNVFEDTEMEIEFMSGDFGVSVTEIRNVIDYCYKVELLFLNDGFSNSESLDYRLKPVYDKRQKAKSKSAKQYRVNGKFNSNPESIGVSVTETTVTIGNTVTEKPQSKVKESKVNKSKAFEKNLELLDIDSAEEPRCTVNNIIADTIRPYASLPEEFKKMHTEQIYTRYKWFVKLLTDNENAFKNLLQSNYQVTLLQFKKELNKFTDEEIVEGVKLLCGKGVMPDFRLVWKINEYIGYYIKRNGNNSKFPTKTANSALYTSDLSKIEQDYDVM